METWIIYIVKASAILFLFHIAYEVFLKRETFFSLNRIFLLSGFILAVVHPFLVIREYKEMVPIGQLSNSSISVVESTPILAAAGIDWLVVFQWFFITGCLLMAIRLLLQLFSVKRIISAGKIVKRAGFVLVEVKRDIAPFSFFNYIFYDPDRHPEEELTTILEHEKVHCRQWHSLDVLFANIVLVILWINPFGWFYLKNIKQNLEFLADREATSGIGSPQAYQYTMLKVSAHLKTLPVSNSFL